MAWTFTVSDLNEYVARSLASDPMLRDIRVTGEISNFKAHSSGHWYFDLKDERGRMSCVMYRQNHLRLAAPAEGERVILSGAPGLYAVTGRYQFYAQGMEKEGQGELYKKYLLLKEQLLKEGCFDAARKKPLPLFPRVVGVVTSRTGAVIHDIMSVSHRRDPSLQLVLRPAKVQGEGAAEDIAAGIEEIVRAAKPDVVIIGRGGGSMEDLWAFNEAVVVRAIAACPVPVVSAVGHEVDVTLSDLAADVRAATPSAAAELVAADRDVLCRQVDKRADAVTTGMSRYLLIKHGQVAEQEKRLARGRPDVRLAEMKGRIAEARRSLTMGVKALTALKKEQVSAHIRRLEALGPRQALDRGYALALSGGRPALKIGDLKDRALLLMKDGYAEALILERKEGDPFERYGIWRDELRGEAERP